MYCPKFFMNTNKFAPKNKTDDFLPLLAKTIFTLIDQTATKSPSNIRVWKNLNKEWFPFDLPLELRETSLSHENKRMLRNT